MKPPTLLALMQRAMRRRPLTSLASAAFGYAGYVELVAGMEDGNDRRRHRPTSTSTSNATTTMPLLPRDRYDPEAISRHWGRRPIAVARRLASIALELGPVAGRYLVEFHALPRLTIGGDGAAGGGGGASGDDADDDDDDDVGGRSRRRRREVAEVELSTRLRSSLASLGPTFVKAGQQLSIRPDLVSPIVLRELQRLCDAVPPFDDGIAMRVLAEELMSTSSSSSSSSSSSLRRRGAGGGGGQDGDGDAIRNSNDDAASRIEAKEDVDAAILRVFEDVPVLVASASLGQVYKARLRSNDGGGDASARSTGASSSMEVAIKIQRPDILETVSLDLYLLVSYGKMVDKLCSLFTNQIPYHETFLNGFANGAYMEMNYVHEAENQMYFRKELHSRFNGGGDGFIDDGDGPPPTKGETNTNEKYNIGGMLSLLRARMSRGRKGKVERVIVPKVYGRYTTERILVTEWIDGTPLARAPPEQIRALIPVGVELFLVQLLDIGRFHGEFGAIFFLRLPAMRLDLSMLLSMTLYVLSSADPHPGES
jgi:hypothetical protein